jgi:hypothetical protein
MRRVAELPGYPFAGSPGIRLRLLPVWRCSVSSGGVLTRSGYRLILLFNDQKLQSGVTDVSHLMLGVAKPHGAAATPPQFQARA